MAIPTFLREVIYETGYAAQGNHCATDSAGNVWVAWREDVLGNPVLAKYDRDGSVLVAQFSLENVNTDAMVVKVDSNDKPVVTWLSGNSIQIARFTSAGAVDIATVTYATPATQTGSSNIDMTLDSIDDAYIIYKDFADNRAYTVKFDESAGTFGAGTLISANFGPFPASVVGTLKIDSNSSDLIITSFGYSNNNTLGAAKIDTTNSVVIAATQMAAVAPLHSDIEVSEDGKITFMWIAAGLISLSKTAPAAAFVVDTAETVRDATASTWLAITSDVDSNIHVFYRTGTTLTYSVYSPSFTSVITNQEAIEVSNGGYLDICVSNKDEVFFVYGGGATAEGQYEQWGTGFSAGFTPQVIIY